MRVPGRFGHLEWEVPRPRDHGQVHDRGRGTIKSVNETRVGMDSGFQPRMADAF